ncbi:hypothetical protein BGZ67_008624 [Mortierella alpina]|nr:hypothetical protein BGZ67_008624 [Mortierella alpina]
MYATNNFRYLRINKSRVLPVNLLLSKEDLEWFNDFTFQEVLTVLKPLLLSRIELYNQGHLVKRTLARTTSVSANPSPGQHPSSDDGLEDVGIVLGGEGGDSLDHSSEAGAQSNRPKRRKGAGGNPVERPKFGIRFGFRASTSSERGGAILVSDKNLGFSRVKQEVSEADNSIPQEKPASRRLSMQLATLEGETATKDTSGDRPVTIREEDQSDNLQVSDYPQGITGAIEDAAGQHGSDGDYQYDENGQHKAEKRKRQQASEASKGKGKGKGSRTGQADEPENHVDQKPTLQVKYTPLNLHSQTLYIVVHSMGSLSDTVRPSSSLSFSATRTEDSASSSAVSDGISLGFAQQVEEEEDSLFPPGMDYFA